MTNKYQTTMSAKALWAVAFGLVAWACSGDDPADATKPDGSGGIAGSSVGGAGGSSASGGTGGAQCTLSNGCEAGVGGTPSGGGSGGISGQAGTGATGGIAGSDSGTGGEPPDGGGSGGSPDSGTDADADASAVQWTLCTSCANTGNCALKVYDPESFFDKKPCALQDYQNCHYCSEGVPGTLSCNGTVWSWSSSGTQGPPCSSTDAGTGGTSGSGGSSGAGGSSTGGTGGNTGGTGGTSGSGGTSGAGGSTGGTSGFGGSTGGTSGSGGSSGAGGSSTGGTGGNTGGTGGTSGSGGTSGAGGSPQALNCSGFTRDNTFPSGMDLTADVWASAPSDIYVATGLYGTGEIAHRNGSAWSLMTLPAVSGESWSAMHAVWGSSANDVWAGGGTKGQFTNPKARLLRRQNKGAWVVDSSLPTAAGDAYVLSIWGEDANNVFVLVRSSTTLPPLLSYAKIFRKNGGSWAQMTVPAYPSSILMRHIWGKSSSDVYAVGTQLDSGSNPVKALLWHYDGNGSWKDITTLPGDAVQLGAVHGAGNEIIAVGSYWDGSKYRGMRLTSTDLSNWTRYNSTVTEADSAVWSPWQGTALVGGSASPQQAGSARLITYSLGNWTEQTVDAIAMGTSGLAPLPGSNQVAAATYSNITGMAGVYIGTCQ